MKKFIYTLFAVVFTAGLFVSCTPESLDNDNTQIDTSVIKEVPGRG